MPILDAKVPGVAVLAAALVLGACGGDAESAQAADQPVRAIPAAEIEVPSRAEAEPEVAPEPDVEPESGVALEPEAATAPPVEASRPREPRRAGPVRTAPEPVRPAPEPVEPAPEPAETPSPLAVPAGVRLEAVMVGELSTKSTKAGDRFEARLTDDVLGSHGVVLVPRGATLVGRVLESRESASSEQPAVLTLAPEALVVDGVSRALRARVVELAVEADARDSGSNTAAKVGTGVVAGAVLGKIIGGDNKDALKGAAAGAAAGAAVAIATKSGHAKVADGARIVVVLDEPMVIAER